ncbi:hypothetical protein HEP89_10470 [Labrenzia sp. 5N]|uniref:hypothetical protein n=1 Tax=Labrenzia sp. 5N TaxID=2723402 RepID=UPI0014465319|nr:hypothetical protein [Labrenzia sp. 5N]NKX64530.1 hypothetical protein [Labrenzia sp. 5N]
MNMREGQAIGIFARIWGLLAVVGACLLAGGAAADTLPSPITGAVEFGGLQMKLSEGDGQRRLILANGDRLPFPKGGTIVLAVDRVLVFDAEGNTAGSFLHDGRISSELLQRMAVLESFSAIGANQTREDAAQHLAAFGLPRTSAELLAAINRDVPEFARASGEECGGNCDWAALNAIERIAEDLERKDVRIFENATRYLVGFGPPEVETNPDYMIAANPAAPLYLSADKTAAATDALGLKFLLLNADEQTDSPGRRAVCVPLSGCGWAEIEVLTEVRPEWLEFEKSTGKLLRVMF